MRGMGDGPYSPEGFLNGWNFGNVLAVHSVRSRSPDDPIASMPAAELRAAIWQSIFTHDLRRYRRTLYARMSDFVTLITGPSGTGKELAARGFDEMPEVRCRCRDAIHRRDLARRQIAVHAVL